MYDHFGLVVFSCFELIQIKKYKLLKVETIVIYDSTVELKGIKLSLVVIAAMMLVSRDKSREIVFL